jgi:hypothetical protein
MIPSDCQIINTSVRCGFTSFGRCSTCKIFHLSASTCAVASVTRAHNWCRVVGQGGCRQRLPRIPTGRSPEAWGQATVVATLLVRHAQSKQVPRERDIYAVTSQLTDFLIRSPRSTSTPVKCLNHAAIVFIFGGLLWIVCTAVHDRESLNHRQYCARSALL